MGQIFAVQYGHQEAWDISHAGSPYARIRRTAPLTLHYPVQPGVPSPPADDVLPVHQFAVVIPFAGDAGLRCRFDCTTQTWIVFTVAGNAAALTSPQRGPGAVILAGGHNALLLIPEAYSSTLDAVIPSGARWVIVRKVVPTNSMDWQQGGV